MEPRTPTPARPPNQPARPPQNGKQKTPEWLNKALGVEAPADPANGKTLEELLRVD